jgi:hypothetical protein
MTAGNPNFSFTSTNSLLHQSYSIADRPIDQEVLKVREQVEKMSLTQTLLEKACAETEKEFDESISHHTNSIG